MYNVITVDCDGYDCQNVAVVEAQNANNALQAMGWTIQSGSDCSSVELCPRCAELARREQAQAAPQRTPGPWTQGRLSGDKHYNANIIYDANGDGVANIYDIPQNTTIEEMQGDLALMKRFARGMGNAALIARAPDLLAENARLRSLLAELIDQLVISELTEEDAARIEPFIGKAKEAIK